MKPEIAFFDIDGTLLSFKTKEISLAVIEALTKLQENGCRLFLATGRAPYMIPVFEGVDFDGIMCFNGSLAFDRETTIFSSPLDKEDMGKLISNAGAIDQPVIASTKDSRAFTFYSPALDDYLKFSKFECGTIDPEELKEKDIYQMTVPTEDDIAEELLHGTTHFTITRWWEKAVDVIPVTGGKSIAMEKILGHYGIPKERSIAFGDSTNDIDMLQYAGVGIAMENGDEQVKAEADYVTGTCEKDGVVSALKHFGWI